ncbi:MAG: C10 family peptidase [Bacteroidaceae bacterium]|nr:C10 family peptidase [Bacteroidaceae bacterium]
MLKRWFAFLLLLMPLVAYSQQSLLTEDGVLAHGITRTGVMPEALRQMLQGRSWQVVKGKDGAHRTYKSYKTYMTYKTDMPHETIGPLLQSIRAQEEPYNLLCPHWTDENGVTSEARCLSGCVATAIEQVMAYYRYPEALLDTLHGWSTDNYVIEDMLPGTRFDWDNYLLDYRGGWTEAQGLAIALPSLAAGMAVHMNYGLGSSGASVWRALEPLQRALGYGMVRYYDRVLYTPARWNAMLRHELEQGRPIVYAGHNMDLGGHAFNIDGIDTQGFYHVNWGYNGYYDGWYDLDLLDPWEPIDRPENGYISGFFCNQSALFMHPSPDAEPLEPDTLALDSLGVVLENVAFLRQPDVMGYVQADFDFVNTGKDSVTYTYEVMTWLPTDTAIFYQADYVGLAGLTLAPGERRTLRNYLRFYEKGERIMGISHDDVTIPFQMPVTVVQGQRAQLEWGEVTAQMTESDEATGICSYRFTVPVSNQASGGYAADRVCYCLYADGMENEDTRHYTVLALPGGESETLEVTFTHLQPATHYTFLVRSPWLVRVQTDFTTPAPTAVAPLLHQMVNGKWQNGKWQNGKWLNGKWFDLQGRPAPSPTRGIIIQNGKKWLKN